MRIVLSFVLALVAVCVVHGARGAEPVAQSQAPNVWVIKEGKHINLVFRTRDAQAVLPIPEAQASQGPLVMLSWGDARYYQAADKRPGMALKAMLLPTRAAVHAKTLPTLHAAPQTHDTAKAYALSVAPERLARMLRRVRDTLLNAQDQVVEFGPNERLGGRFYHAFDRRYSLLFTCNNWAASVLSAGRLPFSPLTGQLAGGVVLQHKLGWVLLQDYRDRATFRSFEVGLTHSDT